MRSSCTPRSRAPLRPGFSGKPPFPRNGNKEFLQQSGALARAQHGFAAFISTLVRRGRPQYAGLLRKRGRRLILNEAFANHFARHARLDSPAACRARCIPRSALLAVHCDELCVAQVVVGCPFEEFKAPNKEGPEPDAVFHLLGGETFAPTTAPGFGQIRERALRESITVSSGKVDRADAMAG